MSNVKKPKPIVEFRVCSMGIESDVLFTDEITHLDGGHYSAIETGQSEAYKDACVREALEQADQIVLDGIDDESSIAALATRRNAAE